jgi:hypothetical protein
VSILDTNLAVILDGNTARKLGLTDEQMFAEVAKQVRRIPGVRQVYEYQLNGSEIAVEDLRNQTGRLNEITGDQGLDYVGEPGPELVELHGDEEVIPEDRFRGDIEM